MAEAIGIISGVLTLIEATYRSSKALSHFISDLRGSPAQVRGLQVEVRNLVPVLEVLHQCHSKPDRDEVGHREMLERELASTSATLDEIKSVLASCCIKDGARRLKHFRSVAWALKEKEVKLLRDRLLNNKASLSLILIYANL